MDERDGLGVIPTGVLLGVLLWFALLGVISVLRAIT